VTRALQLVRQARIAGCALPRCMHRGAVELHSEAAARRSPPSSVPSSASCSFLTFFSNLVSRPPPAALESAKRSAQEQQARAGCWRRCGWWFGGGCVCSCLSHAALQLCKVCSDNAINVVLVPCGHMCLCGVCAGKQCLARACDLSAYRCVCVSVWLCRQRPGSKPLRHEDDPHLLFICVADTRLAAADKVTSCPLCRTMISQRVRTFLS
jgi:hypothetical protein